MKSITITTLIILIQLINGVWSQNSVAAIDASAYEICKGESIDFTDLSSYPSNIFSWDWTFDGGTPSTANSQGPHTVYFYSIGTFEINLEIEDNNGNISETTISIKVRNNPTAYAVNDGPVCPGGEVNISGSGSGNDFSWTGPDGFTSNSQNVTFSHIYISGIGTYNLQVTNSYGCTSTSSTDVVMGSGPDLEMSGTGVACYGDINGIASVNATNGVPPYNYNWFSSGSSTSIATNLSPGWQVLSVTDDNNCFSKDSVFIDEPPEFKVSSKTSTPSECYDLTGSASVTVEGGTPGQGYSYSWSPSGGNNATTNPVGEGDYIVTITDDNNCELTDTVHVDVINEPILEITDSANVSCFGKNDGAIEAEINGGTPNYTYHWAPSTGGNNILTDLSPGIYSVYGIDDNGCETETKEVTITEPDSLIVDTTVLGTICGYQNGEIILDASGGTGSYNYSWSHDSSVEDTALGLGVGSYNVTVSDSLGCSQSFMMNIGVDAPFDLDITPPTTTIHKGDSVEITANIDPNINIAGIVWTPKEGLSCSNCVRPMVTPSDTTMYVVEVTSSAGCSTTDSILINVEFPCGDVFVPTIFSPDGDGTNDFECIKGRCIVSCEFTILNRWGETVFHTTDNEECWDGIYKGKMVESGVYVYRLIANKSNGDTVNETGNITVVR